MKKLIRCSVIEGSSLDFYVIADEKMSREDIGKKALKFFSENSAQDYKNVETDLTVNTGDVALNPKHVLGKWNETVFNIDEDGEFDYPLRREREQIVAKMIEEQEERKRIEAFEKDQLALKESGL